MSFSCVCILTTIRSFNIFFFDFPLYIDYYFIQKKYSKEVHIWQNDKNFLGTAPIGKLLLKLSIPTVIAQLINMLYNVVDRIYIGHIPGEGSLALTGVGVCMPIIMIVTALQLLSVPVVRQDFYLYGKTR